MVKGFDPFGGAKYKAPLRVNPEQVPAFRLGSRRVDLDLNIRTYQRRISALRDQMETSGIDLLIVCSNGEYSLTEMNSFYYLSNFKSMGHSALFLPKDDEPVLVITPSWDVNRAKRLSWISHVVATNDFVVECGRIILDKNWKKAKVGLAGAHRLTKPMRTIIASPFEITPQSSEQMVSEVARIPDELEMMLARKAAVIAEQGYQYLLQITKPGMTEYELAAEIYCYMKTLGPDDNFQLLSASQHNLSVNSPADRRLDVGDVILAEISPSYKGKFIQICRTTVIGSPTPVQLEKYQVLIQAMIAGMKTGVPGVKVNEITKAVNDSIATSGYGQYCYPPYMRVRGHGLGLGSAQPGQVSMDNETTLEEGMMFIIHPNQYIPETGYLLCGESVVVTKKGLEPLTLRQLALDSIPV